jgi:hypothetical protein
MSRGVWIAKATGDEVESGILFLESGDLPMGSRE